MFLSSRHELFVLLGTFTGGIVIGLVFDFFRILRKNFRWASSFVWLQDILMWCVILLVVYATLFITNSGKLRLYEFIGFGVGISVYMVAISRFITAVITAFIKTAKRVVFLIFKIMFTPIKFILKILLTPLKKLIKWIKMKIRNIFRRKKCSFLRFCRVFKKI